MSERSEAVRRAIEDAMAEGGARAGIVNGLANIAEQLCRIADHLSGESGESEAGAGVLVEDRDHPTEPAPRPPAQFWMQGRVIKGNWRSGGRFEAFLAKEHNAEYAEFRAADGSYTAEALEVSGDFKVTAPPGSRQGRTWGRHDDVASDWVNLPDLPDDPEVRP